MEESKAMDSQLAGREGFYLLAPALAFTPSVGSCLYRYCHKGDPIAPAPHISDKICYGAPIGIAALPLTLPVGILAAALDLVIGEPLAYCYRRQAALYRVELDNIADRLIGSM